MSSEHLISVSLIIPCYNEGAGLSDLVSACIAAEFPPNFEIILVDNGSTDNTPSMLLSLLDGQSQIRSVRLEENKGYGNGILFGLSQAKGDVLGWSHADLQADPADFATAVELFESGETEPFVKGKRFGRPVSDVFFTICMSVFEVFLFRRSFWDINAQMFSLAIFMRVGKTRQKTFRLISMLTIWLRKRFESSAVPSFFW